MGNKSFKFKQFEVFHDKSAMKVGTDGVLLGAWTTVENSFNTLDVGTGTGLIALMLAQRSKEIQIVGIEIDADAAKQARQNVVDTPFSSQIEVFEISYQDYILSANHKFDHIVSNPPFFTKSLHSPNQARTHARHDKSLSVHQLLKTAGTLLNDGGRFSFIFPFDEFVQLENEIRNYGWQIGRRTDVFPTIESKYPKRVLLELHLSNAVTETRYETLHIEKKRHIYTDAYIALTKDFYLKM